MTRVRLGELIAPRRLGVPFRWLLGSAMITNLGDGVMLAAGPLLVATQTSNAFLVAFAAVLQRLPFLIIGLGAGAIADRVDRGRLILIVNALRAVVFVAIAGTVLTGVVSIWVVLVAMLLLGIAETFADITSQTLLPVLVARDDLGIANSRMQGALVVANQLTGPPVGALLFAVGMALPFGVTAICFALGAVLVSRMRLPTAPAPVRTAGGMRQEITEGLQWLWHHPPMRTLAITIVTFNITFGAAWGVLVLWAQQRVGLDEVGFGLLTTVGAVGGIAGISCYGWLSARFGLVTLMRVGLILETLTHLVLALTTQVWVAYVTLFVFGAHAFVWGTTSTTIRQRAVPDRLMGRVGSVYLIGVVGGMVIGTFIGGVIAQVFGITGPYWFAFVGSAVLVVVIWRSLRHIADTDEPPAAAAPDGPGDRA